MCSGKEMTVFFGDKYSKPTLGDHELKKTIKTKINVE